MISPNTSCLVEETRDEFTAFLPELAKRLSHRFRHRRSEARAEAVAEGVAHAWILFVSAHRRHKSVTAGTLAHFAGGMVGAGRKVAGNSTVDALSDTRLSRQRVGRHVSLDTPGLPYAAFYRVFGDRRWRWPILDYVGPNIDMEAFLAGCSARERHLIELRLAGYRQNEIAEEMHVSPPAVNQWLCGLRRRWDAAAA